MNNDFKKGFFFGAGVLTVLLIPTSIYLARGFYLDKKLTACVKEANDYKDEEVKKWLAVPGGMSQTDLIFEQHETMVKICRYNYVRKLIIQPLNPKNNS